MRAESRLCDMTMQPLYLPITLSLNTILSGVPVQTPVNLGLVYA